MLRSDVWATWPDPAALGIPGANRWAVDRFNDVPTLQPQPPAQPAEYAEADDASEIDELLGEVVTLTFASWNHIGSWLSRLDALRKVA